MAHPMRAAVHEMTKRGQPPTERGQLSTKERRAMAHEMWAASSLRQVASLATSLPLSSEVGAPVEGLGGRFAGRFRLEGIPRCRVRRSRQWNRRPPDRLLKKKIPLTVALFGFAPGGTGLFPVPPLRESPLCDLLQLRVCPHLIF